MSTASDDLRGWSRGQWGTMVGLVTVVQLGLMLLLCEQNTQLPARVAAPPELQVASWQPADPAGARLLEAVDPTVFALPGPRGFSGAVWSQSPRGPAAPAGWNEDLRWLTGQTQWFGRLDVSTGLTAARSLAAGDGFLPAPRRPEVRPLPLPSGSTVSLDADLAARGWLAPVVVPGIVHTNLLNRTEVQVSVEPDGWVFSAVVVRSSGLARADETAVALALAARFMPLPGAGGPGAERQWGSLWFDWRTVAPEGEGGTPAGGL